MSEFAVYLQLGFDHISDYLNGYDHILFVCALGCGYSFAERKKLLLLTAAFTVGHSFTLALATRHVVNLPIQLIEFLIPMSILVACLINLKNSNKSTTKNHQTNTNYLLAACFGLVHGLGFSNYLKELLGKQQSILKPLLAFNIGLEIGQLTILVIFLTLQTLLINWFRLSKRDFNLIFSSTIAGIALVMIKDRWYF